MTDELWKEGFRPPLDHVSSAVRGSTDLTRPVEFRHRRDRVGDDAKTMKENDRINRAAAEVDRQQQADRLAAVHSFPTTSPRSQPK